MVEKEVNSLALTLINPTNLKPKWSVINFIPMYDTQTNNILIYVGAIPILQLQTN